MKKLLSIFFIAILFVSAGCKKSFFDINQNPNSPTEESLTPELLLPRATVRAAAKIANSYSNYGGWMGYWARSGTYGANQSQEGYTLDASFESDEWTGWYDILYDFDIAEKKATEKGQNYYIGMAKVFKAIGFMYLVDQYNNVPYTEAFDLQNHLTPKYDKGPAIYADLIAQLNTAIELFSADGVDADPGIPTVDKVYGGDAGQWAKLANTLKLKLLIHESEVISDSEATSELASTASVGYLNTLTASYSSHANNPFGGSDEGAYVQPGYQADNLKQNPFWDSYDTDFTGSQVNDYWRANNFMLQKVFGVSGNSYYDERLFSVYDEARTPLAQTISGYYSGANFGEVTPNTGPQAVNQSDVSGPSLAISATQAQWIFTVVESRFLQAEAIARGWIPGDGEDAFEAAVESSFTWLGVPEQYQTWEMYLAGESDGGIIPSDAYKARFLNYTGSVSNRIRIIATQKHIALAGINNFESWVDYRRLDGDEAIYSAADEQAALLSFSPDRNGKNIPLRLIYSQTEYNYNAANVAAEGTINPQSSRIFWDAGAR
ncbi:MAG: SusD/RagB family nutrient-binding outer membrane lipoprotein [Sphingobacteriaceae bacterium]|nr:MAG: SusD/RagB family nutrient-binding outer membrane lipoprotein [Sphingobacteriaceae bacterium]